MRSHTVLLFVCLVTLAGFPTPSFAQQPVATIPQRDPAALAILTQATTALGGPTVLSQFGSAQTVGSIQAVPGTSINSGTFVWLHQFSASGFQFRSAFTSNGQTQLFVSGSSGTAVSANGKVRNVSPHVSMALPPFHLPAVVINMFLANANYTVKALAKMQIRGITANHVLVSLDTDVVTQAVTPEDWYFDSGSGLPLRVEFRLPNPLNATDYTKAAADFANYQTAGGVLTPLLIANTEDGIINSTVTINSVQWNYAVGASDFMLTGSAQ
ncbi:MAG: hypothetical protein JWN45_2098 [Acidobacteriaceae bacterium]|nr:hypothetical protein [Acidobacteriaceae bacterium]